ncbi:hypothetical protein ACFYVL_08375 [Streptomyces sp. NPDC004111]|uniref:hypothetical protein n=1 Tax=Streptomyces sp. NPDC004111 TaxID=3364690 RepID=UPI0036D1DE56
MTKPGTKNVAMAVGIWVVAMVVLLWETDMPWWGAALAGVFVTGLSLWMGWLRGVQRKQAEERGRERALDRKVP